MVGFAKRSKAAAQAEKHGPTSIKLQALTITDEAQLNPDGDVKS